MVRASRVETREACGLAFDMTGIWGGRGGVRLAGFPTELYVRRCFTDSATLATLAPGHPPHRQAAAPPLHVCPGNVEEWGEGGS